MFNSSHVAELGNQAGEKKMHADSLAMQKVGCTWMEDVNGSGLFFGKMSCQDFTVGSYRLQIHDGLIFLSFFW
jgi:hypothetical protein